MTVSDKDIKAILIRKITENGLPVAVEFDFADAGASILVKSETEIFTDDYGSEFLEDGINQGSAKSMEDLSDEGLLQLLKYGVKPGDEDYERITHYFDDE